MPSRACVSRQRVVELQRAQGVPGADGERLARRHVAEEAQVPVELRQRVVGEREAGVAGDRPLVARHRLRQRLRRAPREVVPAFEVGDVRLGDRTAGRLSLARAARQLDPQPVGDGRARSRPRAPARRSARDRSARSTHGRRRRSRRAAPSRAPASPPAARCPRGCVLDVEPRSRLADVEPHAADRERRRAGDHAQPGIRVSALMISSARPSQR